MASKKNYSGYQQKIIKRYYENRGDIGLSQLQELTTELYLAEGAKQERLWKKVESALSKLNVPASRTAHLLAKRDPKLLAQLIQELI